MRLTEIPLALVEEFSRKWRRRIVVGVIALICLVAALIEGVAAARLWLEPIYGAAAAAAIVAGAFLAGIVLAFAVLWLMERRPAAERARAHAEAERRSERTELIAEAIDLGYTFAQSLREKPRRASRKQAAADGEASPPEAAPPAAS
jgi:uncharacterized membrane protein